jgi:ligand-binding sensor domain-containing protein/signal transduction histidine kinase
VHLGRFTSVLAPCWLLAAALLLAGLAGVTAADQLPVRGYGIEEGLAGDSVNAILQDSRGYLWFATTDGVSRFDGQRFTSYGVADGLPQARADAVLESRDGTYWVATRKGLARFVPDRPAGEPAFRRVNLGSARPEAVFSLYEDRAGRVWAGGDGHLFTIEAGQGEPRVQEVRLGAQPGQILSFAETLDGSLWIGTQRGLLRRLSNGAFLSYPVLPHHGEDPVSDLGVDRDGRLWIVHALHVYTLVPRPENGGPGAPRPPLAGKNHGHDGCTVGFDRPAALPRAPGSVCLVGDFEGVGWRRIHVSGNGMVRLTSSSGLYVWDGHRLRLRTDANGLTENALTALAEDRDGNIWLGTESRGVMRVARDGLVGFGSTDGLAHPQVNSIFSTGDGTLYVQSSNTFTNELWLQRFDGIRFAAVRPRMPGIAYLGWSVRQSVLLDRAREWWIATGQGLLRYPASTGFEGLTSATPKVYTIRDGLGGNSVERLLEDSRGNLWIGTNGARPLAMWSRAADTFRTWGHEDGLPAGVPSAVAEDRSGQIWVGFSEGGLVRRAAGSEGRFEPVGAKSGLPDGPVTDLHVDHGGHLWVATEGGGVGRLDATPSAGLRFVHYTTAQGLSSDEILCVTDDRWGRLYLGGHKGLDRLDPATGQVEHFTTADGLASNRVDAAWTDPQGYLWFGTRRGLSRLRPERQAAVAVPQPWITSVRVDGASQRVSELGATRVDGLRLESGRSRVEIEFLALSFAPGRGSLAYQYRLEGFDRDWSQPSASRSVHYANLPAGHLRFLVRAVNPDTQVASAAPAEVVLAVSPPVWRRVWVVLVAALAIAGIVYSVYRYRVSHAVAVGLAVEQMRTHLATDLHDDLGSSLSRISILSEVARRRVESDPEGARLVSEIGEAAREMIEALGENIWAIDPRRDNLRSLVTRIRRFAGDLLEARGMAWNLQAPPDPEQVKLSPIERRHLYLIFKEALNNAARHSEATSVTMSISLAGRRLSAVIRDNGKGFAPPKATESVGRHGLPSMIGRAMQLGGELKMDSQAGQGTEIRLDVPLSGGSAG